MKNFRIMKITKCIYAIDTKHTKDTKLLRQESLINGKPQSLLDIKMFTVSCNLSDINCPNNCWLCYMMNYWFVLDADIHIICVSLLHLFTADYRARVPPLTNLLPYMAQLTYPCSRFCHHHHYHHRLYQLHHSTCVYYNHVLCDNNDIWLMIP